MIVDKNDLNVYDLKNKVIVFPTDTVYGIGCEYENIEGIQRIYNIKHRNLSKPMALLCSSLEQVKALIAKDTNLNPELTKHWPGKLTLIFRKNPHLSDLITAGLDTVGVRIPNNAIALKILDHLGPMVVTSLNESNEPAITKFNEALKYENLVDQIVDGGDLFAQPSTVYDTVGKKILRQGDVFIENL